MREKLIVKKGTSFGRYQILGLVLLCLMTSVSPAQLKRIDLDRKNFKPTATNFGKPVKLPLNMTAKKGILDCNSVQDSPTETCVVRNMPLINQNDSRIEDRDSLGDVPLFGCYDTSILTVILATLANRGTDMPALTGRVKTLIDIKADADTPREIRQLSWYYQMVKKSQENNNQKPEFYPLYIHEVVANFNKGNIIEAKFGNPPCDPYAEHYTQAASRCGTATNAFGNSFRFWEPQKTMSWTNETLISRMRDRYAMIVAYIRYVPVIKTVGGKTTVTFINPSNHKVAVSGFQPGTHPLLINDVGNGKRFKVKLDTNLLAKLNLTNKPPGTVEIVYPLPNRKTFIEYEGDTTGMVFFVEHIDGLRAPNK